ncbi:MAG: ArsR/SmtB family transcription factor [Alphaproteobacteria bacterium]
MTTTAQSEIEALMESANEAAAMLKLMAHEGRLRVLCHLAMHGEVSAGELTRAAGLQQSALSQHLARLREAGLVATRRDATTIRYRLADPHAARILETLKDIYCPQP